MQLEQLKLPNLTAVQNKVATAAEGTMEGLAAGNISRSAGDVGRRRLMLSALHWAFHG